MPDDESNLGITAKKSEDISEWYQQVVIKAGMAEYSAVSGCIVFKPLSYSIWENIQKVLDADFKKLGHKNVYFPLFIPESLLTREQKHVEGFTPEVAWVTHAGKKPLAERLAIRPTSETIMYDSYSKWVRSWRDLPILYNQWNNVVRWEFSHPKPFLRTREFLWQEGHTVHATLEEAEIEVYQMLDVYVNFVEDFLAIPVLKGKKTESEKFAGADYTTTVESLMPDGKALQMGTSHNLGQNFSKAFEIKFLDQSGTEQFAWQTSWGMSTRVIGAMILMHGDDKGLIIPPKIAPTHAVIIPIIFESSKAKVLEAVQHLHSVLSEAFSVEVDLRDGYTPGWKFNEWELKGVPVRIEIGPKDVEKKQIVMVRRDTGAKEFVPMADASHRLQTLLDDIQSTLFRKAKSFLEQNISNANDWEEFNDAIEKNMIAFAFHCGDANCELGVKEQTQATARCIPFEQPQLLNRECVKCGKPAKFKAYFARNY
ncbi:MAG TPA: proline--tRNA ligase [Candidatus Nanoarchaeia archaeon]|nr:proline--tRNA ligase [Candidatus Nanoarchaeia archaeon]